MPRHGDTQGSSEVPAALIRRLFYPQVPLVLSAQGGGRVSAMPVVSYASVSDKPPMVAVACNPKSFTCKLAVKARCFSLTILGAPHLDQIASLATTSGAATRDKLKACGLAHSDGRELAVPTIKGAEATLELAIESKPMIGDHVLLVGEVRAAYASKAFRESWDYRRYEPILYAGWLGGLTTYPSRRT